MIARMKLSYLAFNKFVFLFLEAILKIVCGQNLSEKKPSSNYYWQV